jgi:hypothetical protein
MKNKVYVKDGKKSDWNGVLLTTGEAMTHDHVISTEMSASHIQYEEVGSFIR